MFTHAAHTFPHWGLPSFPLAFDFHEKVDCAIKQARNAYENACVKARVIQAPPWLVLCDNDVVAVRTKDVLVAPIAPGQACQAEPHPNKSGPSSASMDNTLTGPNQAAEFAEEKVRH